MKITIQVDTPNIPNATVGKEVEIRHDQGFDIFKEDWNREHEKEFDESFLYRIYLTIPQDYLLN